MSKINSSQKGFGAVEMLVLVVILVLIGAGGWLAYNKQNSHVKQTNASQANTTGVLQPEDITAKIKRNYESQYKLLNIDENNQPQQGEMSIGLSKRSPFYKTAGYDFYTDTEEGSTIDMMAGPVDWATDPLPRKVDISIRTDIADTFKGFGLARTGVLGSQGDGSATYIYTGKGLICTVEAPASPTSETSASCGRIATYKATAAKMQPIASVLPNLAPSTVLSGLKITDSKVRGYQRAEVNQSDINGDGSSIALLYRKNNGKWVYFKNVQMALSCSEYNTADLRNAFKGEPCYSDNGQTSTMVQ